MSSQLIEICQLIISSETFRNYDSGKRLLSYLCEQTEKGEIPKETTIGVNLFDADRAQEMNSAKVRVYVHNLRRKLALYYRTEGKHHTHELVIPVGAYKPQIKRRNSLDQNAFRSMRPIIGYVMVFLITLLGAWLVNNHSDQSKTNKTYKLPNGLFDDLLTSESPVLIVLGDMFIFSETNKVTGEIQTVRNYDINSGAEFEEYLASKNDSLYTYEEMSYSFLAGGSADWIKTLTRFFYARDKAFSIRVNTRVQAQDLHDYNIIFVGLQKTAGIFNSYFEMSPFLFQEGMGYRHIMGKDTVTYISHGDPDALHTDFGFIARYQGPRNNVIYMFSGLWDTSVSQALKLLFDPEVAFQTADQIKSDLGSIPKQFEILLEVDGVDRTDLNAEILVIHKVE